MKTDKYFEHRDEILNGIDLPEDLDRLIIDSVEKGYGHMKKNREYKKTLFIRRAAVIAGVVAAAGAVCVPVKALVLSIVEQRMEQIPAEEMESIAQVTNEQEVNADTFSRQYTQEENERFRTLSQAYQEGTFPEKELTQEDTVNSALTDRLYYTKDTSTFYLPERALTDEELLEIIDFNHKRDYALMLNHQGASVEDQKAQEEIRRDVAAQGGISEAEAVESARLWLSALYGISDEGMEIDHYVDIYRYDYPVYTITFSIRSNVYYYFTINSGDGSLCETFSSLKETIDAPAMETAKLTANRDSLLQKARELLSKPLKKEADYVKTFYEYKDNDGYLSNFNCISFFFLRADGSCYKIDLNAAGGDFTGYSYLEDFDEYKESMHRVEELLSSDSQFTGPEGNSVFQELP